MLHLRNILKYITANSHHRRIQTCSLRERRVRLSRYVSTNRTFATLGQSVIKFQGDEKITLNFETKSLPKDKASDWHIDTLNEK